MVREWLNAANRDLTSAQFVVVNDALGRCNLPLYTRLVFEEVCRWSSYTPLEHTRLEFTVKGIINKLFDKVSMQHILHFALWYILLISEKYEILKWS